MKKKITLTLEAETVDWLKSESINISAWLRAVIAKKRMEMRINIPPKNTEKPAQEDINIEEILTRDGT